MPSGWDQRLRVHPERVVWREIEGRVLALDLRESRYLASNESARLLWHRLLDGASPAELTRCLAEAYGLDEEQAKRDVYAFLDELERRGLLTSEGEPG